MKPRVVTTFTSPNWDERPVGAVIDTIVFHYTDMLTLEAARTRLTDPAAKVSAHYLVAKNGVIYQLVPDDKRAWHAGESTWRGRTNLNHYSIGIELENKGHSHGYEDFPATQIHSLVDLTQYLVQTYRVPFYNVVGHADIAPQRKQDPGEKFPWQQLAAEGIGFFPHTVGENSPQASPETCERMLQEIGYTLPPHGADDSLTTIPAFVQGIQAFQRRFVPHEVSGHLSAETICILQLVHAAYAQSTSHQ